uniref:Uncharacterized protein n=1 Tax=Physcomitrium patens TaxID=3218 RepID=A0A2K1KFM7_PHYPA|nr:hypothetical protein PHYPA_008960 [Physcomitrium patens]
MQQRDETRQPDISSQQQQQQLCPLASGGAIGGIRGRHVVGQLGWKCRFSDSEQILCALQNAEILLPPPRALCVCVQGASSPDSQLILCGWPLLSSFVVVVSMWCWCCYCLFFYPWSVWCPVKLPPVVHTHTLSLSLSLLYVYCCLIKLYWVLALLLPPCGNRE